MSFLKTGTIKSKLILCTMLVISILLSGFIIFFVSFLPKQFNSSQETLNSYLVANTNKELSTILTSAHNQYQSLINSGDFFDSLPIILADSPDAVPNEEYISKRKDAISLFAETVSHSNNLIHGVLLTDEKKIHLSNAENILTGDIIPKTTGNKISFFALEQSNFYTDDAETRYIISFPVFPEENSPYRLCFVLNVPGHIFSAENSIVYILDGDGCIFTTNQLFKNAKEEKKYYNTWQNLTGTLSQKINGANYHVTNSRIEPYNWTLISLIKNDNYYATSKSLTIFFAIFCALSIVFMFCLSLPFSNAISQNITIITHEIDTFIDEIDKLSPNKKLRRSTLYAFFNKYTLKKKLWIYFAIVMLVPTFALCTTVSLRTKKLLDNEFTSKSDLLFSNIQHSLVFNLNELNSALSAVIVNTDITELLYNYSQSHSDKIYNSLEEKILSSSNVFNNSVFSYFKNNEIIATIPSSKTFLNDDFYKDVVPKFTTVITKNPQTQSYHLHIIKTTLISSPNHLTNIGYCAISISPEEFNSQFFSISNELQYYLSDEQGQIFLSNTPQSIGMPLKSKDFGNNNSHVITRLMNPHPINLTLSFPTANLSSAQSTILIYLTLLFIAILLLVWLIINLLNNHIIDHISYVNIKLNTDIDLPERYANDELDYMTISVENMKKRMSDLINQVYKHRILETELKINAMQSQITPHFLYNTLAIISSLIQIDDERAVELTLSLADFFRLGISQEQSLITVEQEWNYTNVYLDIHRIILGEHLKTESYLDPEIKNNTIIKFSLQPIVENSLKHGMYLENDLRKLKIKTCKTSEFIKIYVRDNGQGMDEKQLSELRNSIYSNISLNNTAKQIGLKNVHERIRLYFGDEYGLKIYSKYGSGTIVVLKIPVIGQD